MEQNNITMEQKPIIEIKGLKKRYRLGVINNKTLKADWQSFWAKKMGKPDPNVKIGEERLQGQTLMALNGIDLKIYPGEAVGIIGVNGAGKSTMLKLISRVTAPTEGEIVLRGKITSMLEVGTGFNPELTGRENIYMNGTILGMTRAEVDAKIEQIIAFSEVKDFIDTPVKRYSRGMYVKLAFSVAAHLDSDIMIMDEVLAVGDVNFQKKCLSRMSDASTSEGRTILYVSHNMSTIRQICTRCIVMKEGKIIYDGDVEEAIRIYSEETFKFELKRTFRMLKLEEYPPMQALTLTSSEILDRDNLIFDADESLKVRLGFRIFKPVENMECMISLRYVGINLVGTYVSKPLTFKEAPEGQEVYADFELDLSNLVPGKYFAEVTLGTNNVGRMFTHDFWPNVFGFEISENTRRNDFSWDIGRWSYNILPVKSQINYMEEENK